MNQFFNKNTPPEISNTSFLYKDIPSVVVDDDIVPYYKTESAHPLEEGSPREPQWESLRELMVNDLGTAFDNSDSFSEGFRNSFFGKQKPITYDDEFLKKTFGVSGEVAGHIPYLVLGYLLSSKIPGIKSLPTMATGAAIGAGMSTIANTTQKAVVDPLFDREGIKEFINRVFKDALISSLGGAAARKVVSMSPFGGNPRALAASQFFDEGALLFKKTFLEPDNKGSGGRAW